MVTTGNNWNSTEVFPSPTGVNYYELYDYIDVLEMENEKLFPSPTGVNYYESQGMEFNQMIEIIEFPSPTGVNYYESRKKEDYYD